LRRRSDFQQHPLAAIRRRLWWHLRWRLSSRPWRLRIGDDLEGYSPKSGPGALIYFQGYSEPSTARFLKEFLRKGMCFWDVGAHFGEYSLVASQCVGETGTVEAFEPQPAVYSYLLRNVEANRAPNIRLHPQAISDVFGTAELSLLHDPSLAYLTPPDRGRSVSSLQVQTISLDQFHRSTGTAPNLIKVDVEGAEHLVLEGSKDLMALEQSAPTWIVEYEPDNCERFRYQAEDLINCFAQHGYATYWLTDQSYLVPIVPGESKEIVGNVVASKTSFTSVSA